MKTKEKRLSQNINFINIYLRTRENKQKWKEKAWTERHLVTCFKKKMRFTFTKTYLVLFCFSLSISGNLFDTVGKSHHIRSITQRACSKKLPCVTSWAQGISHRLRLSWQYYRSRYNSKKQITKRLWKARRTFWLFSFETNFLKMNRRQKLNSYLKIISFSPKGFELLGEHYDVHRFHTPLIYGRRGDADVGEGISLARVNIYLRLFISVCLKSSYFVLKGFSKKANCNIYLIITYELPIVSARAVP